jgi:WD40 repeat protein
MMMLTAGLCLVLAADPAVDRFGDPLPPFAVARLGTLRYRSDHTISNVVVLANGRVAFVSRLAVVVMDLNSGRAIRRIGGTANGRASDDPVTALAAAPDGQALAIASVDFAAGTKIASTVCIADAATGRIRQEFTSDRPVEALAFLADGRQLASLDDLGVITIWEIATRAKVRELTAPDRKLRTLAASADGRMLAAGGDARDGQSAICLWDSSGRLLHTLAGHTADVRAVAFTPDGRTLVSGATEVRVWDVATGRELRQLTGRAKVQDQSDHSVRSLAVSPDGRLVAAARADGTVRTWSAATSEPVDDADTIVDEAHALAFRDGRTLLVGSGYSLLFRDMTTHAFTNDNGSRYGMVFLNFTPDGRRIVSGDGDTAVRTWVAADGRLLAVKTWSPTTDICPMVSPGGAWVAFTDGTVCIGDVATGQILRRLPNRRETPAAVSADGRRLATLRIHRSEAVDDAHLTVWDVATGTLVNRMNIGQAWVDGVVLAPDGRAAFTAEPRGSYRLRRWDVGTGRVVQTYTAPDDDAVQGLTVSSGGRRLAAAYQSYRVMVWDAVSGRECWRIDNRGDQEFPGAFSPDGMWLTTEAYDSTGRHFTINLRDARTGNLAATLRGLGSNPVRVAFSPDGRRVAASCTDGTALIWDVEAATERKAVDVLDPTRQAELWDDLAGGDGLGAHAVDCLQAAPAAAVKVLKPRLRPAVAVPAERIDPLIAGVDSPTFAAREKAQRDLVALGVGAEPAVRAARATATAEAGRRLDAVLAAWEGEQRRLSRAVEVLEYVRTPYARKLLAELAAGDPNARLTQQAKAALKRLPAE